MTPFTRADDGLGRKYPFATNTASQPRHRPNPSAHSQIRTLLSSAGATVLPQEIRCILGPLGRFQRAMQTCSNVTAAQLPSTIYPAHVTLESEFPSFCTSTYRHFAPRLPWRVLLPGCAFFSAETDSCPSCTPFTTSRGWQYYCLAHGDT